MLFLPKVTLEHDGEAQDWQAQEEDPWRRAGGGFVVYRGVAGVRRAGGVRTHAAGDKE